MYMKAVQVMLDEALLDALDHVPEVQASGRSAVIREAVEQWLRAHRTATIDAAYAKGYGKQEGARPGIGPELEGWDEEGEWPAE